MTALPPRQDKLVMCPVGDEVLVFDPATNLVHTLSTEAAAVLRSCDGQSTSRDLARAMQCSEHTIDAVVEQLREVHLVGEPAGSMSRRVLIQRSALVGGGAVLASMVAPAAFAHASGTGTGTGSTGGVGTVTRYEAEALLATGTFTNTAGTNGVQPDGRASGGAYAVIRTTSTGTFTATISVPATGTYSLASGDACYPDTAIYSISIDGTTLGGNTDTLGPIGGTFRRTTHGSITLAAGTHSLKQAVVGTSSSGNYTIAPDYYELTRTS